MKKRVLIYYVSGLLIISLCLFYLYKEHTYTDILTRNFLKKYGWSSIAGEPYVEVQKSGVHIDLNNNVYKMQIAAAEEIGLDPLSYYDKRLLVYYYKLGCTGIEEPLSATLWIYNNKIVCAYIAHNESNLSLKYWSLNTPYEKIVDDIKALRTPPGSNK